MSAIAQVPPKHIQIRDVLSGRIARGEYPPGSRLPPVRVLAAEFGVSPVTAGEAVRLLAAEGLVRVLGRRRGTLVAGQQEEPAGVVLAPRLVFGPQERLGWAGTVPGEVTEVVGAHGGERLTGMADARGKYGYITAILRLEAEPRHGVTPVFRRTQLVRDRAGVPVRLEVSWFDASWAEQVTGQDGGRALASETVPVASFGGVAWLISAHSGRPVLAGSVGVEARGAKDDGRETTLMGLEAGEPLLAGVYDWQAADPVTGELAVIEYGEYIERPGRVVQFRYAVSAVP